MVDTVSTVVMHSAHNKLVLKFLNKSDSTGESAVTKVHLANYTGVNGGIPTSVIIEDIIYDIKAMQVQISSLGTTPIVLALLGGFGHLAYDEDCAGINSVNAGTNGGDLAFTTIGAAANSTYDITLVLRING